MKAITTAAVFVLLLAGCATDPIPTSAAQPVPPERILDTTFSKPKSGTGEVLIKRDSGFGGSACNARVFIDGKPVAEVSSSEKVSFYLPVGDYIISARPNDPCGGRMAEIAAKVIKDKVFILRLGYGSAGDFNLQRTAF